MHALSGNDPDAASTSQDPTHPPRSHTMREPPSDATQTRRARHRSVEIRSNNRLSGFFNNLIHRRDPTPTSAREGPPSSANRTPLNASRSPSPPPRPVTPPPTLPPPTLQELGLSLTEITAGINPAHPTSLPTSGAFLAPHYLLLCHSQGLDVLPIVSPPASQPYALIRRVSFKSVVVMEHRGVLVAIAGRRDGVRVYALEEVKKAIEWRMDLEVRRERERQRRESKRAAIASGDPTLVKAPGEKSRRASISVPPRPEPNVRASIPRKASTPLSLDQASILPLMPRPPVPRSPTRRPRTPQSSQAHPYGQPPPYASAQSAPQEPSEPDTAIVVHTRTSVNDMITSSPLRPSTGSGFCVIKTNWEDGSDDEAINIVAAGASGGQALDERTSAMHAANANSTDPNLPSVISPPAQSIRGNRSANLDVPLALPLSPASTGNDQAADSNGPDLAPTTVDGCEMDDEDEDHEGQVSLAQMLLESRLPNLPPVGTRRPQQPILISASHPIVSGDDEPSSPRISEAHTNSDGHQSLPARSQQSRRRRWSVLINGNFNAENTSASTLNPSPSAPPRESHVGRVTSFRSPSRPSTAPSEPPLLTPAPAGVGSSIHASRSPRSTHFLSRILNSAFQTKRSEDHLNHHFDETENSKKASAQLAANYPPPKLEFVKLPGTKSALMVKAVETPKKSFLAILCGERGEKVELFAGTYRSALGLSRTFILPDSPKSLELQLQGDDLVEVFLVFAQNVFGLEPATVRVREVRIGRAERRAARRRARELRATGAANTADPEEEANVNVNVTLAVGTPAGRDPALIPAEHPEAPSEQRPPSPEPSPAAGQGHTDELLALSTAQMGPYTTFQQLGFAPNFPLASVADDYIIPPTYPEFIEYRDFYEPEPTVDAGRATETTPVQFSPPGLPVPPPAPPCKWYYRDPKGVMHGPWKTSLMQTWYKDGLLPLDLPVRREGETTFTPLRDLRLQCVDPTEPFRPPPPPVTSLVPSISRHNEKPLLSPISLLAQPRYFGPPALFYSSRGGHSTAIVDARGRSVLKGRLVWSNDDVSEEHVGRMGDVKRLEAFDVKDRSVLVAMRQGGVEAIDLRDALLRPADESRTTLPMFSPGVSNISRRAPFVWKIGMPVSPSLMCTSEPSSAKPKPSEKQSTGPVKPPGGKSEISGDSGSDYQEEVFFLGRKDDELYFCERNATSFRILRLCTQAS